MDQPTHTALLHKSRSQSTLQSNPVQSRFIYEACLKTTTAGQRAEQSEIAKKKNTIKHKNHKNMKGNPHTESKAMI